MASHTDGYIFFRTL